MGREEHRRWEARYREGDYQPAEEPSEFLRGVVADRPPGTALDIATGTGRNARWLAAAGWTVHAVDIARAALTIARRRSRAVEWIQADVDSYCFPEAAYDLVTVTFFDARDCLPALKRALAPDGLLCYEHHLKSPTAEGGPSDRHRFAANELLVACSDLTVLYYSEREQDNRAIVRLVARNSRGPVQPYPPLPVQWAYQRRCGSPDSTP